MDQLYFRQVRQAESRVQRLGRGTNQGSPEVVLCLTHVEDQRLEHYDVLMVLIGAVWPVNDMRNYKNRQGRLHGVN